MYVHWDDVPLWKNIRLESVGTAMGLTNTNQQSLCVYPLTPDRVCVEAELLSRVKGTREGEKGERELSFSSREQQEERRQDY